VTDLSRDNRLMMLALFLWASGEGLFTYIQPIYIQQLGANPVQIGTVLALAGLAMTAAFLPGGILSDRIPRRIILMGGWALGIVGVLTMASARDWRTFIPGIMLYSFSAFCVPAISATVADAAGGAPLARVITFVYAGYSAGSIISPAVGGWLAQMTNMRTVYLIAAVCYAVSTLVVLMLKPQPVKARAWQKPSVHVVRSNGLLALIVFAMFLPLYIGIPLAPNFMRNVVGWPVDRIGLLGSLYALGLTALSPTLGRLSAQHPIRGLVAGQALVWVSLGLLFIGAQGLPAIASAAFFLRGGYGACRSLAGAQIAGQASAANRGAAFGLAETSVASAQMVAPYLAGWLYDVLPAAPIFAGLALIPAGLLLTPMLGRQAQVAGRKSQSTTPALAP
jgi:DHA1 family tetracycline resistance protein-like MFS transporter